MSEQELFPPTPSLYEIHEFLPTEMEWFSVQELATLVGRTDRFIYNAIRSKDLRAVNFAKTLHEKPFYGIARIDAIRYLNHFGTWLDALSMSELKRNRDSQT